MYTFYNTSHLAKVIECTFNNFNTFNAPLSQLLLTGVRKKSEKSCLKIWRGVGAGVYICSAVSEKKVAPVNPRACEASAFMG